ncbi:hypothetical protein H4S08_002854 [Coemansia sp. RSA 1365]|nr:hypothetical protein H4S08_002854 [Coemansia sp. RSA 1365]
MQKAGFDLSAAGMGTGINSPRKETLSAELDETLSTRVQTRPPDERSEGGDSWRSSNTSSLSSNGGMEGMTATHKGANGGLHGKLAQQTHAAVVVSAAGQHRCRCSQCDPNYYTMPMHMLFEGKVEYVCRDCQFSTLSYTVVQQHEVSSGHRRWYNYPQ